jgi:glycosyltransferase involved in cell wall biosynthesis
MRKKAKIREKLTVIIPTYNVEAILEDAIRSVLWADEILIVDSFSTDGTLEIAKKYNIRVIQHEYVYSAKQKNWAIPQAKYDWILLLDSDEVVTAKLKRSIEKTLAAWNLEKFDGFGIARKHFFFGRFLRWGGRYPLYNIRLFRKNCRYEDRDVHAHIILDKNRMKNIRGDILHFSDRDIEQFMEKFNRYSRYQANYMLKVAERGIKIDWLKFLTNYLYFKSIIKDFWHFIPGSSFLRFSYMYIFRMGFLDGKHGFIIATFYGLQDYVARTKYLEMVKRDPQVRIRFQKKVIEKLCYQVS